MRHRIIFVMMAVLLMVPGAFSDEPCRLTDNNVILAHIVWPLMDTDGDGSLSHAELQAVFGDVDAAMFDAIDWNGDGLISLMEFSMLAPVLGTTAVGLLDVNGDGVIAYEEVSHFASETHFARFDRDNNGVIDCLNEAIILAEETPEPVEGEDGEGPCPLPEITLDALIYLLFAVGDLDDDNLLTYEEIKAVLPIVDQAVFSGLDVNGDGFLEPEELRNPIVILLLPANNGDVLPVIDLNGDRLIEYQEVTGYLSYSAFQALDVNNNGVLDCEDYALLTQDYEPYAPDEGEDTEPNIDPVEGESDIEPPCPLPNMNWFVIRLVFAIADLDGDGYVTLDEIERISPELAAVVAPYFLFEALDPFFVSFILQAANINLLDEIDTNGDGVIQYEEVADYIPPEYFVYLDHNGNGAFDCEDYAWVTAPYTYGEGEECGSGDLLLFVVARVFPFIDLDGDGVLSRTEVELLAGEEADIVFTILDRNNDGVISLEEVGDFLLSLPINVINILDLNGDGAIQYEEVEVLLPAEFFPLVDVNNDGVLDCADVLDAPDETEGEVEGEVGPEGETEGEMEGETEGEAEPDWAWPYHAEGNPVSNAFLVSLLNLFELMDADGSGSVTYAEVAAYMTVPRYLFDLVDLDGDGILTENEIRTWQQSFSGSPEETVISVARTIESVLDGNFYAPGESFMVHVRLTKYGEESFNRFGFTELVPEGWNIDAVLYKAASAIRKTDVQPNLLQLEWETAPAFPFVISYRVTPPEDAAGIHTILGQPEWEDGTGQVYGGVMTPTVLVEAISEAFTHSADTNRDWRISLRELLRVIQLYNSGGYHVDENTEDGYAPGDGPAPEGWNHAADYGNNWRIDLAELLRVIQLYNSDSGFYYVSDKSPDGYMPAPF